MAPSASSRTCAVPLLCSQSEAAVAATLETSDGVPAVSISAKTLEHFTLVYIWGEGRDIKIYSFRTDNTKQYPTCQIMNYYSVSNAQILQDQL